MSIWIFLAAIPLALVSGFMRGVTGFGGAMVMTAPLAMLVGPQRAVVATLALEAFAALNMLPGAVRAATMRTVVPLCVAACLTVPIGGYLLTALEPELIRRLIAATVLVFSFIMLAGFRYKGRPRTSTSIALGGVSGVLVSATSVGAPPVILYLLSGPDSAATTRANLNIFLVVMSTAALIALLFHGALDTTAGMLALGLGPFFFAGAWLGNRVFPRIDERRFRRYTLLFLICLSSILLII
jgi:uncharacterized protein